MEDCKIIELYWQRCETAIEQTQKKYGRYCFSIANNILPNEEDAQECVNDTYLAAWNAIPPNRPKVLSTFLGKLTPKEGVLYLLKRDISGNAENFWGWLDSNTVAFTSRNSDGSYYIYLYELA